MNDETYVCGTVYTYIVRESETFSFPCPSEISGMVQPAFGHAVGLYGSTN
jgi:hypothetical protein